MILFDKIHAKAQERIDNIKKSFEGVRPNLAEIARQVQGFLTDIIQEVQSAAADNIGGPEKKEAVMNAAALLFDQLLVHVIKLPFIPGFISSFIIPWIKPIYLKLVSGAIDAIVNVLKINKAPNFKQVE